MASDNIRGITKNGLPFIIVTVVCGYATDAIPHFFPEGDFRDWAYRSVPLLSMILLFVIKTIKDFGGMSFTRLMFAICASPEKKRLKCTINDTHASPETRQDASTRYDEILKQEMELGSRLLRYISQWPVFKKAPTPPQSAD